MPGTKHTSHMSHAHKVHKHLTWGMGQLTKKGRTLRTHNRFPTLYICRGAFSMSTGYHSYIRVHVRKEIRLSAGHQWHPEDAAGSPGCQWRPEDTVSPGYRGILRIPCPEDTGACPGIRCPQDTAPYPGDMPVSSGCPPCPRTPTRVFRRVARRRPQAARRARVARRRCV